MQTRKRYDWLHTKCHKAYCTTHTLAMQAFEFRVLGFGTGQAAAPQGGSGPQAGSQLGGHGPHARGEQAVDELQRGLQVAGALLAAKAAPVGALHGADLHPFPHQHLLQNLQHDCRMQQGMRTSLEGVRRAVLAAPAWPAPRFAGRHLCRLRNAALTFVGMHQGGVCLLLP